jgi:hypothetical protein
VMHPPACEKGEMLDGMQVHEGAGQPLAAGSVTSRRSVPMDHAMMFLWMVCVQTLLG